MKLRGDESSILGDYGELWLRVCASGADLLHGTPDSRDLVKADVSITYPGELAGTRNPSVWAQVKTTQNARDQPDGGMTFDLDVATYEVLRQTDSHTRRILVVVKVSDVTRRIQVTDGSTQLMGRARWTSLEGLPAVENTSTVAVQLPGANRVDGEGLRRMLQLYGTRSSSFVPDISGWEEAR